MELVSQSRLGMLGYKHLGSRLNTWIWRNFTMTAAHHGDREYQVWNQNTNSLVPWWIYQHHHIYIYEEYSTAQYAAFSRAVGWHWYHPGCAQGDINITQKVKQSAELHKVYCFATLREIDGSDRLMDKLSNTIAAYRTAGSRLADSVLAPPLQFSWLVYEVYEVVHKERP